MNAKELMYKNLEVWADLNDESTNWTEVVYVEKKFGGVSDPLVRWCIAHLNEDAWTYYAGIPSYKYHFYFARPEDATLFRLRWM